MALAGWHRDRVRHLDRLRQRREQRLAVQRQRALVGDHEAPARPGPQRAGRAERAGADVDRVPRARRATTASGPLCGTSGRASASAACGAASTSLPADDHRARQRLVQRPAARVERVEAAPGRVPAAGAEPSARPQAVSRSTSTWTTTWSASAARTASLSTAPPPSATTAGPGAPSSSSTTSCSRCAEGRLALAVEELRDRLAQALLEQPRRRPPAGQPRCSAERRANVDLPAAMKPITTSFAEAASRGPRPRRPSCPRYLRHPIRSR